MPLAANAVMIGARGQAYITANTTIARISSQIIRLSDFFIVLGFGNQDRKDWTFYQSIIRLFQLELSKNSRSVYYL
jgi:hypothetical protein